MSARSSAEEVAALGDIFSEPLTAPELARALDELMGNGPAELVSELYGRGLLAGSVLARALPTAWSLSESPLPALGHQRWRELFAATGFTMSGVQVDPPTSPVVLYRGASHLRRRGWSWTPDLGIASRFALRHGLGGGVSHVYWAEVPPRAMLAAMDFGEPEFVVDTAGLTIRLHERNAYGRMMAPESGLR